MPAGPTALWSYATADADWQPFTVGVSASLEAEYAQWRSSPAGLHPGAAQVRTGAIEHTVCFNSMRRATPGDLLPPGAVRREEYYPAPDVGRLQAELALLRERVRELESEVEATAVVRSGREDVSILDMQMSGRSWRSKNVMTPGANTVTSGGSWRTAASMGSGLFAMSPESLESMAEWLFALRSPGALPAGKAYERILVPEGDPRKLWLQDYIQASLQPHRRTFNSDDWFPAAELNIVKICEVRNEAVNNHYWRELNHIRSTRPGHRHKVPELDSAICVRTDVSGPRLNEALLFHGCKWETVFSILREGFDSRLGGTNVGAAFGIGTYFSTVASKADLYTQRWEDWDRRPANCEVPGALRCMLVARVALGEIHELRAADSSLRRPPLGPDGLRCDSVLGVPRDRGGCVDYDEFVVYKVGQAAPQFIVEYEHLPTCRCRSCNYAWA